MSTNNNQIFANVLAQLLAAGVSKEMAIDAAKTAVSSLKSPGQSPATKSVVSNGSKSVVSNAKVKKAANTNFVTKMVEDPFTGEETTVDPFTDEETEEVVDERFSFIKPGTPGLAVHNLSKRFGRPSKSFRKWLQARSASHHVKEGTDRFPTAQVAFLTFISELGGAPAKLKDGIVTAGKVSGANPDWIDPYDAYIKVRNFKLEGISAKYLLRMSGGVE